MIQHTSAIFTTIKHLYFTVLLLLSLAAFAGAAHANEVVLETYSDWQIKGLQDGFTDKITDIHATTAIFQYNYLKHTIDAKLELSCEDYGDKQVHLWFNYGFLEPQQYDDKLIMAELRVRVDKNDVLQLRANVIQETPLKSEYTIRRGLVLYKGDGFNQTEQVKQLLMQMRSGHSVLMETSASDDKLKERFQVNINGFGKIYDRVEKDCAH